MADNGIKLFGFEINRSKKDKQAVDPIPAASVVAPTDDDGTGYVTAPSIITARIWTYMLTSNSKTKQTRFAKYRANAGHPEVDMAIEEIVNEAIVSPRRRERC